MAQIKPQPIECPHCLKEPFISQLNVISDTKYNGVSTLSIRCPLCQGAFSAPGSYFESEKDAEHRWTSAHFKKGKRAISKKTCLDKKYQSQAWADYDTQALVNMIDNFEYLLTLDQTPYIQQTLEDDFQRIKQKFESAIIAEDILVEAEEIEGYGKFVPLLDRFNLILESMNDDLRSDAR